MEPAFMRISPVNINGTAANRLMVVLKTGGCEYAKRTGGCTVCGFMNHAVAGIGEQEMVAQLDYSLTANDLEAGGVREIDLLTLGSFCNDKEVSPGTRRKLLQRIAALDMIERVSFESRAEYVTVEKLEESKEILAGKTLEFGIGLESSDDRIRNVIIKKGLSKKGYEGVVAKVKEAGCDLLTYLLIKPQGLSEQEAIDDAVASADFVFETARTYGVRARAAFEPVFICENTRLEELFLNKEYRLVNLWSIVEVVRRIHGNGSIFVGLSDESLSFNRMPNSCPRCSRDIAAAVERYNRSQDISEFNGLDCDCRADYERKLSGGSI